MTCITPYHRLGHSLVIGLVPMCTARTTNPFASQGTSSVQHVDHRSHGERKYSSLHLEGTEKAKEVVKPKAAPRSSRCICSLSSICSSSGPSADALEFLSR